MKSHESQKKVGRLSTRPRRLVLDVCFWAFSARLELEQKRPTPNDKLKGNQRVKGIEPSCAAWEAAVLPLNYTRILEEVNSESFREGMVTGD